MKKKKQQLTYGGKPHICYKLVPLEISYIPLSEGITICLECGMRIDSEEEKKHYALNK
jgi:hypothetical protein